MPGRLPLLAGILVGAIVFGACNDGSTPVTPTPPPPPPPPPTAGPPPPPAEPASLASLTLNPPTVGSQGSSEGTVTLSAAAPSGGAVVTLFSNNSDIAKVPASVTVAAGSTSNTFRIETATVPSQAVVTIEATYAGVTRTSPLTVLAPALEARFRVTSNSRGTDACDIVSSDGEVDCQFDASGSRGFIARYHWNMRVGGSDVSFSTGDDQAVVTPSTRCSLMGNGTPQDGTIAMEVSLQLEDRAGNRSGTERQTVRIHHNNRCGY